MLRIIVLLTLCHRALGLIGFDCGGPKINATTISLIDTGDCDLQPKKVNSTKTYIQLLQLSEFRATSYIQCKVSIARNIFYCGMHSHISAVNNGFASYVRDISYEQCQQMHVARVLNLGNGIMIDGLKPNSTTTRSVTIAGSIKNDGTCDGSTYSDIFGSWDKVIVQANLKITLRSGQATVHLNTGKITLKSGTTCVLSDGSCFDLDEGYTFWKTLPVVRCDFAAYDVLYEGRAHKTIETDLPNSPEVFSLTTEDITFALTRTNEIKICGFTLIRTEHPRLFILETQPGNTFVTKEPIPVENLDIFAYVNSKFVYIEKHIRNQMSYLYNDIMRQKCELEKQVLANALAYASTSPEELAYIIMKGPGFMATPAGEVIHVVKCTPTEVELRHTDNCYNELPVTYQNRSFFLTPKTRMLKQIGTGRQCNGILPVMFNIDGTWVRFLPKPLDAPRPVVLEPKKEMTWKYLDAGRLATSGIYTQRDLDNLREHIMFPAEKPAVVNNLVQGMSGNSENREGISLYNLFDQDTLDKIATDTFGRIWTGFISFGSVSAGVLAIFLIVRIIKLILDTIIRGYALNSAYGCSIHLLGAIWSSLTSLLLHRATPSPPRTSASVEEPLSPPQSSVNPAAPSSFYIEMSKRLNKV